MKLDWDKSDERYFQHGVDRGVLYKKNKAPYPVSLTNMIVDPRPFVGNGWSFGGLGTGGAVSAIVATAQAGVPSSRKITRTATTIGAGAFPYLFLTSHMNVQPGDNVKASMWLRNSVNRNLQMRLWMYNDVTNTVAFTTAVQVVGPAGFTEFRIEATVPEGTTRVRISDISTPAANGIASGDVMDMSSAMCYINDEFVAYFDGGAADNDLYEYNWAGTVNNSVSTRGDKQSLEVWNGITGIDESGNGASSIYYIDGQIYLADVEATDFAGALTAFFWPEGFSECIGMPQVAEGLVLDNQKPQRFGVSYRTLIGSGLDGDMFGYQIHMLYNAMASIGQRQRKTLTPSPEAMEFNFDIVATPVTIPGFRPTAHLIIDTRYLTPDTVTDLENMLYGYGDNYGALPDPVELFELLNFGDAMTFTVTPDGFITIEGKASNIVQLTPTTFQINNINATAPDVNGQVTVSDGGDTTVIIL